jgi:hypothetical protein
MERVSFRESAKIYQFPTSAMRRGAEFYKDASRAGDPAKVKFSDAAFGGSWYHEDAIREEEDERKS